MTCLQFSPLQYICILSLHLSCTIRILLLASSLNIELCLKSEFLLVSKSSCIADCSEPFQNLLWIFSSMNSGVQKPLPATAVVLRLAPTLFRTTVCVSGNSSFRGVPCYFPLPLPIQVILPITFVLSVVCLTCLHFEVYGNIENSGFLRYFDCEL